METMEKTYTQKEVDELIIKAKLEERERARKIAYDFMETNRQSFASKKAAGNTLAFIKEEIAEECRYIGNVISGGNALSAALGETMFDRILKEHVSVDKPVEYYLVLNIGNPGERYTKQYKLFYDFDKALDYAKFCGYESQYDFKLESGKMLSYQTGDINVGIYKF